MYLPIDCKNKEIQNVKEHYLSLGFKITKEYSWRLEAELPNGWTAKSIGNTCFRQLIDNKGRVRAEIFRKREIHEQDFFIRFNRRFTIHEHIVSNVNDIITSFHYVLDNARIFRVCKTDQIAFNKNDVYDYESESSNVCVKWLEENYPDYKNPNAYWN